MVGTAATIDRATGERFRAAVRDFSIACFWDWAADHEVADPETAHEVIRRLRLHGGRAGWQRAAELITCL